ncbi:MAG: bifunctional precorrin-2 dehydrogenase/sirohydrochlorin ferrochelatase [Syntrophorhabdaceae bacterium]|nr:bifunctional precorrin-2 dehydrogenase/sirohydrochlorin ferrochelatase [Syntrophorhabdaceae bacterium]
MKNIKTNSQTLESSDRVYYPVFLDVRERLCLVVGGGKVAERKANLLINCGAKVRVVAPTVSKRLIKLNTIGKIEIINRNYQKDDLKGAFIVFAATDSKEINREIKKDASEMGIMVNVVDDPEFCDFIVPSIVKKGPVTIAISTSGTLPLFSRIFKDEIKKALTDKHIQYVKLIGNLRKIIIKEITDPKKRKKIMDEIKRSDMDELVGLNISELKKRFLS